MSFPVEYKLSRDCSNNFPIDGYKSNSENGSILLLIREEECIGIRSSASSVSIATGLSTGRCRVQVLARGKTFSPQIPDRPCGPPGPLHCVSLLAVKRPERKLIHL